MHVHICVYVYTYIYTHVYYVCIYTYIYMHYTNIYIYLYMCVFVSIYLYEGDLLAAIWSPRIVIVGFPSIWVLFGQLEFAEDHSHCLDTLRRALYHRTSKSPSLRSMLPIICFKSYGDSSSGLGYIP